MNPDVTQLLSALGYGDPHAATQLLPLVYDELRKLAAQRMAQEQPGQTLQATALVHEAYLRQVRNGANPWKASGSEWRGGVTMNAIALIGILAVVDANPAPEVEGLLATRVTFTGQRRAQVADAVLALLATCAHSEAASEEGWLAAQRLCHLHIRFPQPRAVAVHGTEKTLVAEVVVTFPLPSTGGIWVRSGDRYRYFAKYGGPAERRIQALLGQAKPAD